MSLKFASRPDQYEDVFGPGARVMLERTMEETLMVWHTLILLYVFLGHHTSSARFLCHVTHTTAPTTLQVTPIHRNVHFVV
jgi:hypothetical protein